MKTTTFKYCLLASALCLNAGLSFGSQPYWEGKPFAGYLPVNPTIAVGNEIYGISAPPGLPGNQWDFVRFTDCGGWEVLAGFMWQNSPGGGGPFYVDGNDIYVAGRFDTIYGDGCSTPLAVNNIAKYNTVCREWSAVGDGTLTRPINCVAVDANHTIYIGCFPSGAQDGTDTGQFLKWTGSAWVTVGNGLMIDHDSDLRYPGKYGVTAMTADGTNIYLAGGFAGGYNGGTFVSSTNVIKWTGSAFVSMSGGIQEINVTSENPLIESIAVLGTNVFFAGSFVGHGDNFCPEPPQGIFRYSTSGARLPCESLQLSYYNPYYPEPGEGYALSVKNGVLYLAGYFDLIGQPCGGPWITAHSVAQWNNGTWSTLTGPSGEGLAKNDGTPAWGVVAATDIGPFVTGVFDTAGGVDASAGWGNGAARYVINPGLIPNCLCHGYPGIVAWWPLEGTAADIIGGNNGSLTGSGNYSFVQGEVNQAIHTTTKPAGVTVPNNASLNMPAGTNFTIEAWVQPETANTSYGVMSIVEKRYTPNDQQAIGYELCLIDGKLAFQMSDTLASYMLGVGTTGPDLRDGNWHHVAVTVIRNCPTGGRLYVDGQCAAIFDPTSKPGDLTTTQPLLIGMHPSSWLDCNFRGGIDEVTIYKYALDYPEILSVLVAGSAGKTCQ